MLRKLMRIFFLFLLTIASCWDRADLLAAEPETSTDWTSISSKDNVAIYRRPRPGPGHNESKVIGEIAAPIAVVRAVIDDVESYAQFMPYTVESRVLKRDTDSLLTYQRISAPLVSDRDYTVRIRMSAKTTEGETSYFTRWETQNALGPAPQRGVVRVNLCDGSWLLEPLGPNNTRATYTILTDSGGVLPAFIKDTGSQIGLRKMFAAIRKQVSDPKYAAKK